MCLVFTEKTASDPLEPELQMIVGHFVCAGNKPRSSARAANALDG